MKMNIGTDFIDTDNIARIDEVSMIGSGAVYSVGFSIYFNAGYNFRVEKEFCFFNNDTDDINKANEIFQYNKDIAFKEMNGKRRMLISKVAIKQNDIPTIII